MKNPFRGLLNEICEVFTGRSFDEPIKEDPKRDEIQADYSAVQFGYDLHDDDAVGPKKKKKK